MTISPNMLLDIPVVGETLGPEWAQKLNEALERIDAHTHVASDGVKVPTAGININLDLPMNGFAITEANALSLQDVDGTPELLSVYSDEGDLYYRNASGTAVQLTTGDTIVGTVGAISGLGDGGSSASFSDLSEDFSWFYNGSKLAAFNIGDLRLYPFDGTTEYSNKITIKSPLLLASDYSLTLPTALPGSNAVLVRVESTGQLVFSNTVSEQLTLLSPLLGPNGSASLPTYSFTSDPNTGIYRSGADTLNITTGGTSRLSLSTSVLTSTVPIQLPNGSISAPSLSFTADSETGFWVTGTDSLELSVGGVNVLTSNTTTLLSNVSFRAPSLNLSGGGAFKIKLVNLGTSTAAVLNAAHGLTATSIIGVIPSIRSGSDGYSMSSTTTTSGTRLDAEWDSTNVRVRRESSGASVVFYATIFYV